MRSLLILGATLLGLAVLAAVADVSTAMAAGAQRFLASLRPDQRTRAALPFEGGERRNWHYVPRARKGIPLGDLDSAQRRLADDLLKTGLGTRGYTEAMGVLALEGVLREREGPYRDPGLYFVSLFGVPSASAPWGWRVEGHHLSLNYTVVPGRGVGTAPAFFGANPSEVREGPLKGLRPLAEEEDLARALVQSLDAGQRGRAVFAGVAPREIVTGSQQKVQPLHPAGIPAGALGEGQRKQLAALLDVYLSRMTPELAEDRTRRLRDAGSERVHFAWAGGFERGQPHYYRIQGPTFLVEYDNTQDGANHIHTVWRDFEGDFGEDLLARHYRETPHR
ncbi:MAG TPA: DUF3500 domain-containing protein [Candidatus Polarisedimenticolaceae bacterium]|nr:DUF3500 domain-containing protein [Candidatus Polarisedimenticolaceae bacterium]